MFRVKFHKFYSKLFQKKRFLKDVFTLMIGTAFAQVITILSIPALTRIYSPEDFGIYAVFVALTSILASAATGRYELAIVLAKKRSDAANLLMVCIFLSVCTSIVIAFTFIGGESILIYFRQNQLIPYLWYFPIYILLLSSYQSFYYWMNREKNFIAMSKSKVIIAGFMIIINLILNQFQFTNIGLIFSITIAQCIGNFYMLIKISNKDFFSCLNANKMYSQFIKYKTFPQYLIVGGVISNLSQQLPVFILSYFYCPQIVGFFSLGQKSVNMPISLITQAMGDVFRQRASENINQGKSCNEYFKKFVKTLFFFPIIPLIILFVFASDIFVLIYGEEWRAVGEYTKILIPMYFLKCVVSPISGIFVVLNRPKIDLLLQLFIISLLMSFMLGIDFVYHKAEFTIMSFGMAYILIYIVTLFLGDRLSK